MASRLRAATGVCSAIWGHCLSVARSRVGSRNALKAAPFEIATLRKVGTGRALGQEKPQHERGRFLCFRNLDVAKLGLRDKHHSTVTLSRKLNGWRAVSSRGASARNDAGCSSPFSNTTIAVPRLLWDGQRRVRFSEHGPALVLYRRVTDLRVEHA